MVQRNPRARAAAKTEEDRRIAKQFGREFFDGERRHGYGGYRYDGRWLPVARRFVDHYRLGARSSILDVGAGKGFLMYDFLQALPQAEVRGLDVSQYAKENAYGGMGPRIDLGSAESLPYPDRSFDLVVSINSIHNLKLDALKQALREIERVGRFHKFISVDAWRTEEERKRLMDWILTAETYMHVDDWHRLFSEVGYTGDVWWFIP